MAKRQTEHERYQKRLQELYQRSASAKQATQKRRLKHPAGSRLPKLKHHIRWSSTKRAVPLLLVFTVILLLLVYVVSPLSKITSVKVVGNDELTTSQAEKYSSVYPGRYIWGVVINSSSAVKRATQAHPELSTFSVKMTGPQAVQLKVKENPHIGTVSMNGHTYELFGDGQMARTNRSQGIDYRGFDKHNEELREAAKQVGQMQPAVRRGISSITRSPSKIDPDRLILVMSDGNMVYARLTNFGTRMKYYPAIVATMSGKGVVDLQFGAYSYLYGHKDDPTANPSSSSSSSQDGDNNGQNAGQPTTGISGVR